MTLFAKLAGRARRSEGTGPDGKPITDHAKYDMIFGGRTIIFYDEDAKNCYIHESVGIACGFLIAALHHAGLATLTHTPNPMSFLSKALNHPATEKPYLLIVAGRAAPDAPIPNHALVKKPLSSIMKVY